MSSPTPTPLKIASAEPADQAAALGLVFCDQPPESRGAHVAGLLRQSQSGSLPLNGLLAARRGEAVVGAVWAQLQPGRVAAVWAPQLAEEEPPDTGQQLAITAVDYLRTHDVRLAQCLLETDTGDCVGWLHQAGFMHAADLLYLVSTVGRFPTAPTNVDLEYHPCDTVSRDRLVEIVERTYQDTLDCPTMNGVRAMQDVLDGYRKIGTFDANRWLIVRHADSDVGCLLLTDHEDAGQWELIYMGLVPETRGKGWGLEVTRHAQWMCREAGRKRLVLAVDASNGPALEQYASAGFMSWDRRSVFLRIFDA